MLQVYKAASQAEMDKFISGAMIVTGWTDYAFMQASWPAPVYPAQFVIVRNEKIKLATIELLKMQTVNG